MGSGVRPTMVERKRAQRQRDRLAGWTEVTVKVAKDHAHLVREYAASLPPPDAPTDPNQLSLLAQMDAALEIEDRQDHIDNTDKQGKLI